MFTQAKFRGGYNLKFVSAILFSVTLLVGGFFISNVAAANETAPTIVSSTVNTATKTVVYTFSEPIKFVNQANPATETIDPAGLVKIYTATSYAALTSDVNSEPTSFGGSNTASLSGNVLTIVYSTNLPANTYLADTWGYTVTNLASTKLAESATALFTATAPIQISDVPQLRYAIENQADGQTWIISAGNYGLDRFNDITVQAGQGQTGWYFPITANNLTIEGQGNPVIYGNEFSLNGNWSTQNLISVFGNNVTLKGLTLMPKAEGNKTIEVLGNDVNIEDVVIQPNTIIDISVYDGISIPADKAFSKEWGGSIYFSHAGNHTVKNVIINNGGISFRYSPSGTHVTFDNVNIVNKTSIGDINGYRYSSGFNNPDTSIVNAPKVTYKVDASTNNLTSALAGAKDGDVIEFTSNITTSSQLDINKAITLDGAGHTLTAGFSGGSVIMISVNGVTIKNLIEDGGTTNATPTTGNRGINIYKVTGVLLDNVTASNNSKNGIVVNGSTVIVNKITTSNNGWEGIDVDMGGGVTTLASLTVNGISVHNETKAAIRIDSTSKIPTPIVTDTNHQYSYQDIGIIRDYTLLAAGQTTPNETGTATVTDTNKDVVITSASLPLTIALGNVLGATIDFDSLIDNNTGVGIIPQTTINSAIATVEIPAGTTVTAPGWNGIMSAPTVGTTSGTAPSGFSVGNTVIEMGSPDHTLNFSNAVKVTLTGVTGTVGYRPAGSTVWQTITTQCTSATVPGITSGECYLTEGGNTIIWTYHFTTFGGFDVVRRSSGSGGGSYVRPATPAVPAKVETPDGCIAGNKFSTTTGRNCNAATPAVPAGQVLGASTQAGQVLGAEKFNFIKFMKKGLNGSEVIELQKFLNAALFDCGTADGKFGAKTKAAVIKFQIANGLKGDGVIGALTRAALNK